MSTRRTGSRASRGLRDHVSRRDTAVEGFEPVLTPANAELRDLSVGRLRIDRRGTKRYRGRTGRSETLLHILVGSCTIEASGPWGRRTFKNLGERVDVFSGLPTSVVLGPKTEYLVTPTTRTVDIASQHCPVAFTRWSSPCRDSARLYASNCRSVSASSRQSISICRSEDSKRP